MLFLLTLSVEEQLSYLCDLFRSKHTHHSFTRGKIKYKYATTETYQAHKGYYVLKRVTHHMPTMTPQTTTGGSGGSGAAGGGGSTSVLRRDGEHLVAAAGGGGGAGNAESCCSEGGAGGGVRGTDGGSPALDQMVVNTGGGGECQNGWCSASEVCFPLSPNLNLFTLATSSYKG